MYPTDEKELVRQIKKDPQAFGILYDHHYTPIFSYVFRRLGNYELARDITAETFLKALQKIGGFEWKGIPVSAWLYRIASNEMNLYLRKSRYKPSHVEDVSLHIHLPYEPGIETEKAAMEKVLNEHREFAAVQQALVKLDIKYQEVIALRFFESKSINEIAEIVQKKEGTVKSLLSRGLEKLRKAATFDHF